MSNSPLITIGIPTYQRFEYLKEATNSALSQDYALLEVLVSDDGTSDEIASWGKEMQRKLFPRFRYKRNSRNLGLAGNWNSIADIARGDYLVVIGDDDRLKPSFVSSLVPYLSAGAAVAFCNQYIIDAAGHHRPDKSEYFAKHYHRTEISSGRIENPARVVWKNSVPMSAALIKCDLVRNMRFKEDLNNPEIELFARIAEANYDFYFCPDYLAEYRVHAGSETSNGLRSERLSDYLIDIPVSAENETFKRKFLASIIESGVGRALTQREWMLARKLFSSNYYPEDQRFSVRGLIYKLTLALPTLIGGILYSSLTWVRKKFP